MMTLADNNNKNIPCVTVHIEQHQNTMSNTTRQHKEDRRTWTSLDTVALALAFTGLSLMLASPVAGFRLLNAETPLKEMELQNWKLDLLHLICLVMVAVGWRLLARHCFRHKSTSSVVCLSAIVTMVIGVVFYVASSFFPTENPDGNLLQFVGTTAAHCGYFVAFVVFVARVCAPESDDDDSEVSENVINIKYI